MRQNKKTLKKVLKLATLTILVLFAGFVSFMLHATKDDINATPNTIEEKLRSFHDQERMAGFAVSVFTADEVIYSQGMGFADIENEIPYTTTTLQYIASISKTTIGISLLKAQELRLLELDDPVNRHVPFRVFNPAYPDVEITIRHLATHTSSMAYNEQVVESLYVSEAEKSRTLSPTIEDYYANGKYGRVIYSHHSPGANWDYSNMGAGLAAYIIERVSGMTYADFTRIHIFEPLGMNTTHWFESEIVDDSLHSRYYEPGEDAGINPIETTGVKLYPARDMITSVEDLTKYGQAILSHSSELLSEKSFKDMLSPGLNGSVDNQTVDNQGVFWMIDRNQYGITYQLTGMNGGDNCIKTMMWLDVKMKIGYIFIGNTGPSKANRVRHILIYGSLVSLGDHFLMNSTSSTTMDRLGYRWHNIYSRISGLF